MTGAIGERAARVIKARAGHGKLKLKQELERMNIIHTAFYAWKNGRADPSAYYLQQMALAGYDVIYILTGKENIHAEN